MFRYESFIIIIIIIIIVIIIIIIIIIIVITISSIIIIIICVGLNIPLASHNPGQDLCPEKSGKRNNTAIYKSDIPMMNEIL